MKMITILTPTYNRAFRLNKLYESLKRQTCREFEWLLVDDGSTDNTKELYESWNKEGLDCRYFYKANGGKHTAINYGVKRARGEYIFIVDSDDYLTKDAIEKVTEWTAQIKDYSGFAGVSGLRGFNHKKAIGERPQKLYIDCKNTDRKKYGLRGDKAEIYKKEILEKYPFPEFSGERFLSEDTVWNAIARDGYQLRWYNQIIYIGEYLDDGLTRSGLKKDIRLDNFKGYTRREQVNVKAQYGFEKYMELGRYIDLVKKKRGSGCASWIIKKLNITVHEYILGYVCYSARKYGKILKGMVSDGR